MSNNARSAAGRRFGRLHLGDGVHCGSKRGARRRVQKRETVHRASSCRWSRSEFKFRSAMATTKKVAS